MANNYVVVDVGGTKVLAAAIADGKIVARHKERTERKSKKRLLEQLEEAIGQVLSTANFVPTEDGRACDGIALGVPGVVDGAEGRVVFTPNAPLSDTPLAQLLGDKFGAPVLVGNDARLGTLGEARRGAGKGASSAFGIFVGTGIGGGLMIEGRLIEGFRALCGEIGHLMVPLGADVNLGLTEKRQLFLEDLCSRTAIENQLRHAISKEGQKSALTDILGDKGLERIRSGALKEALKRKDPLVTDVIQRASYLLGLATASVLHVVDPEVVIFGGGVIEACGDWMLPQIEKTARKVAMPGTGHALKIVRSELGDEAILWGCLHLLKESGNLPTPQRRPDAAPPSTRSLAQVDKPLNVAS